MKLKAINPIEHDGKRYEPGKLLPDIKDEDQVQALLSVGAAEMVSEKAETAKEKAAREKAEKEAADLAAAEAAAAEAAAAGNA